MYISIYIDIYTYTQYIIYHTSNIKGFFFNPGWWVVGFINDFVINNVIRIYVFLICYKEIILYTVYLTFRGVLKELHGALSLLLRTVNMLLIHTNMPGDCSTHMHFKNILIERSRTLFLTVVSNTITTVP